MSRRVPIVVLAGALGLSACAAGAVDALPPPPTTEPPLATTTLPDLSSQALNPVSGRTTTTTAAIVPGSSVVQGTVAGPAGPVPAAIVRLERVSDSGTAYLDTSTRADGTFAAPSVMGGAYRVRAWRAPDLAMGAPVTLFVGAGQTATVQLQVTQYGTTQVNAALAPNPPMVGERAQLVVQVVQRSVAQADGTVSSVPVSGASVELQGSSEWGVTGVNPAVTDAGGEVSWTVRCTSASAGALQVLLGTTVYPLNGVSGCVPRATTTTTTSSSTTSTTR